MREVTKKKLVEVLGQNAVDDELAKEAIPTASANHLIFQHMVDIHDQGHPHNTRARVPRTNAPPQYLLDFHYITSILMQWGSKDVLGHHQPLRRTTTCTMIMTLPPVSTRMTMKVTMAPASQLSAKMERGK